jgi:hypothetical protein
LHPQTTTPREETSGSGFAGFGVTFRHSAIRVERFPSVKRSAPDNLTAQGFIYFTRDPGFDKDDKVKPIRVTAFRV